MDDSLRTPSETVEFDKGRSLATGDRPQVSSCFFCEPFEVEHHELFVRVRTRLCVNRRHLRVREARAVARAHSATLRRVRTRCFARGVGISSATRGAGSGGLSRR